MQDSFDIFEYVDYLRGRWRTPVLAIAIAAVLSASITLLLPKKYTARVSILIEPPGISDSRIATAVSPVYLESLRSYERFSASDSLFAEAVSHFGLQDSSGMPPLETLKRRVLQVSKPRDTRVLELAATLPDPRKAHEFVLFVAEKTVALNKSANVAADRELLDEARRQMSDAQARLTAAQKAAAQDSRLNNPESIADGIRSGLDVVAEIRQNLIREEAELAESEERLKSASSEDTPFERRQVAGMKARTAVLRERVAELTRTIDVQKTELAARAAQRDQIQTERRAAESRLESALTRLRDAEALSGTRSERLRIIDPGIVPQRPSSPDLLLNVVVSSLAAAIFCWLYLTAQFSWSRRGSSTLARTVKARGIAS